MFRPGKSRAVSLRCGRGVWRPTWALQPATLPLLLQLQFLPYDERPLPAIHKQPVAAAVESENGDTDVRGATAGEAEPLTEKALREAGSAVDALGEALVKIPRMHMGVHVMCVMCH